MFLEISIVSPLHMQYVQKNVGNNYSRTFSVWVVFVVMEMIANSKFEDRTYFP